MKEFASRTQQVGVPELARDFAPAEIDLAAMPVRVERQGELLHVVGVTWGGNVIAKELLLEWNEGGPVDRVPVERDEMNTRTWALWRYTRPMLPPGRYRLALHVFDPPVRTRRLDIGYYARVIFL
jgi:hypothetical protein